VRIIPDNMETLVEISRDQLKMLRFLAFREIKRVLEESLKTDTHKIVYENSTGKSMREIAALAGVAHPTVQGLWEKWSPLGIVTEIEGQKGRYERICSLRAVGIEVPPVRMTKDVPAHTSATPQG
jgi:hypothetical protein